MAPVVAFAVTSHGFGHAARTCAVIEALGARHRGLEIEILSAVPAWFFHHSLGTSVRVHDLTVDIGLVQRDALTIDLEASRHRLSAFWAASSARQAQLAARLRALEARVVVADIAPLALFAAHRLGLPSVLVENFTWDWIYRALSVHHPLFGQLAEQVAEAVPTATVRCQAEPCCAPQAGAMAVSLVCRPARRSREETRRALGIPADAPAALVTMGGIPWHPSSELSRDRADGGHDGDAPWLVMPADCARERRVGRTVILPHHSRFYHPDLVAAVDAVVGKLGYSTLAETAASGRAFAYVPRPDFPESARLEAWARRRLDTVRLAAEDFVAGQWHTELTPLLARQRAASSGARDHEPTRELASDGAARIADRLLDLL